jgi:hypothetical protein
MATLSGWASRGSSSRSNARALAAFSPYRGRGGRGGIVSKSVLRVIGAVTVGVLSLALIAAPAGAKPPKPKTPKNVVVLTGAQVMSALLALDEMPTGYAADADTTNTTPNATGGACKGPNVAAIIQASGAAATGRVAFTQNPATGPSVRESVVSLSTAKMAHALVSTFQTQAQSCTTYVTTAGGGTPISVAVSRISFPNVGDETFAARATASGSPGTTSGSADEVVVRSTNNVIFFEVSALAGPETNAEQQLLGKAVSKLGVVIASAAKKGKK